MHEIQAVRDVAEKRRGAAREQPVHAQPVPRRPGPEHERGSRYDDPAFGLEWPEEIKVVSDKDASWPDWDGKPIR